MQGKGIYYAKNRAIDKCLIAHAQSDARVAHVRYQAPRALRCTVALMVMHSECRNRLGIRKIRTGYIDEGFKEDVGLRYVPLKARTQCVRYSDGDVLNVGNNNAGLKHLIETI